MRAKVLQSATQATVGLLLHLTQEEQCVLVAEGKALQVTLRSEDGIRMISNFHLVLHSLMQNPCQARVHGNGTWQQIPVDPSRQSSMGVVSALSGQLVDNISMHLTVAASQSRYLSALDL